MIEPKESVNDTVATDGSPPPTTSAAMPSTSRRRRYVKIVLRWGLELAIVFIGVFAAFRLQEYRAEQEAQARREQIMQALVREIEDITVNTRQAASQMPQFVAFYDSTIAVGAMPPLEPMLDPIRMDAHMWEAALESGGLDLIDVPTMYRLSAFYNMLNAGFEQLEQLRHLSETMILPNMDRGTAAFYDPATTALRPQYTWYLDGRRRLGALAEEVTRMGDSLVADLKREDQ